MQKSKQKYHISMEKYNIKKGLIVYTCIVLVFGGCIQAINDKYIKEQLTLLFVDLLLIEAFLAVTFSVQFFRDGYIIRHDEIVFFHKFKKNRKKLKEIEAVVISNAYIYFHGTNPINMWKNGKIIPCPWFTLFFEKIDPSGEEKGGDVRLFTKRFLFVYNRGQEVIRHETLDSDPDGAELGLSRVGGGRA